KTAWHRMGVAQQGLASVDVSTFDGLNTVAVDKLGRPLNAGETLKLHRIENKVNGRVAAETQSLGRLSRAVDTAFPRTKVPTTDELFGILSKLKDRLTPCEL